MIKIVLKIPPRRIKPLLWGCIFIKWNSPIAHSTPGTDKPCHLYVGVTYAKEMVFYCCSYCGSVDHQTHQRTSPC